MADSSANSGPEQRPTPLRNLGRRLRNYCLTGLIVTGPIGITIWLAAQIVDAFDSAAALLLPRTTAEFWPIGIPGLGILLFAIGLTLIGFLTANFLGRTLIGVGERLLSRMPVIRSIYGALKQIFETVLSQSSRSFREVVLIEYPRKGIWTLGFVTGRTQGEIQRRSPAELVNVFVPTTPNPTSGFLLFVARSEVVPLSMSVEDALKFVVSTGLVVPQDPATDEFARDAGVRRAG
jgi:uncharacterized membrane protein